MDAMVTAEVLQKITTNMASGPVRFYRLQRCLIIDAETGHSAEGCGTRAERRCKKRRCSRDSIPSSSTQRELRSASLGPSHSFRENGTERAPLAGN